MIRQAAQATRYLQHYFSSINEHGAHSPFLYELLTECIYAKRSDDKLNDVEAIRGQLLHDNTSINTTDLGAGSTFDGTPTTRSISSITRHFSKSPKLCRLLYRLVNYFKPQLMLELGTSMGISAMYQSLGNPSGTIYTIEGCPETFKKASRNIELAGLNNIKCLHGNFEVKLPEFLNKVGTPDWTYIDGNHTYEATMSYFEQLAGKSKDDTILIFDDINWSDGMRNAWDHIIKDRRTTMTLDLFFIGIVFFKKGLSKENFRVRF